MNLGCVVLCDMHTVLTAVPCNATTRQRQLHPICWAAASSSVQPGASTTRRLNVNSAASSGAQGTERFHAKHYEACSRLYSAAMQFCSDTAQRAKSARLLALCSLACDAPSR